MEAYVAQGLKFPIGVPESLRDGLTKVESAASLALDIISPRREYERELRQDQAKLSGRMALVGNIGGFGTIYESAEDKKVAQAEAEEVADDLAAEIVRGAVDSLTLYRGMVVGIGPVVSDDVPPSEINFIKTLSESLGQRLDDDLDVPSIVYYPFRTQRKTAEVYINGFPHALRGVLDRFLNGDIMSTSVPPSQPNLLGMITPVDGAIDPVVNTTPNRLVTESDVVLALL